MALLSNIIGRGTLAARPAAGTAGSLYYATDGPALYRDNGTTWDALTLASSGLTVEEVDGSPTDNAVTKIVFPNGTLSITGHVATYTPAGGGGGGDLVRIAQTVLTTATASINFASIPGTYSALRLVGQVRGDTAAAAVASVVRFNGDTGANYDLQTFYVSNGTVAGTQTLAGTSLNMFAVDAATAPAGAAGAFVIDIPNYAGTTFHKQALAQTTDKRASDAGSFYAQQAIGFWRATAAITSISLAPGSGNFVAGSTVTLYGLS